MALKLSPHLFNRFYQQYVRLPAAVDEAEAQRLNGRGTLLLEQQLPVYQEMFFDNVKPPVIELHPGVTLPGLGGAVAVTSDGERAIVHIAADARDVEKELLSTLRRYMYADNNEWESSRQTVAPSVTREYDRKIYLGQRKAYRSHFSMSDGPDHALSLRNSIADVKFYKQMKASPDSPAQQEWQMWRDYLFDDAQLERFDRRDWLRCLRVLNGYTTTEMADALGIAQGQYTHYEIPQRRQKRNENQERRELPLARCFEILDRNLFNLPTEPGSDSIKKDYARKFLQKFGYGDYYIENTGQLASAVKAVVRERFVDRQLPEMDKHAIRTQLLRDSPYCERMRVDTHPSEYLLDVVMQSGEKEKEPSRQVSDERRMLARRNVLEMAQQAQNLGDLLKSYADATGLSVRDIAARMDSNRQSISNYHHNKNITPRTVQRIIDYNAYDFPRQGQAMHAEVQTALRALSEGRQYHNPYMSSLEAARTLGISTLKALPERADNWVRYAVRTPKSEAWQSYWNELKKEFIRDGAVSVDGVPVRAWLNSWDELQVHKDDVNLLDADPRWKTNQLLVAIRHGDKGEWQRH